MKKSTAIIFFTVIIVILVGAIVFMKSNDQQFPPREGIPNMNGTFGRGLPPGGFPNGSMEGNFPRPGNFNGGSP